MTITFIVLLSVISWTICLVMVCLVEQMPEDHKWPTIGLIVLNFIIHGAFQFGAAWQRMDTNEKFNLTTKTIQKP